MIKLKNISKKYEKQIVLENLDLDVNKGDMLGIMGVSGSGKSTLLNILGTIDTPTSGQYQFYDTNVLEMSTSQIAQFRNNYIGFIFQQYHLIPHYTVAENILLPHSFGNKRMTKEDEQYIGFLCDEISISHLLNKKAELLSGGEQQRVAIVRALAKRPDIILADEPTGNLDENNKSIILDILNKINQEGTTLIVVTHDISIFQQCHTKINLAGGGIFEN